MRIGLDCIHELPATYADMVDKDYLCPIVIYASKMLEEGKWPEGNDKHYLTDDVYLRVSPQDEVSDKEGQDEYYKRYAGVSYYIVMDGDEITEGMIPAAFDKLNNALSRITVSLMEHVRGITFYYEDFIESS